MQWIEGVNKIGFWKGIFWGTPARFWRRIFGGGRGDFCRWRGGKERERSVISDWGNLEKGGRGRGDSFFWTKGRKGGGEGKTIFRCFWGRGRGFGKREGGNISWEYKDILMGGQDWVLQRMREEFLARKEEHGRGDRIFGRRERVWEGKEFLVSF